jgi:hypothetical protein
LKIFNYRWSQHLTIRLKDLSTQPCLPEVIFNVGYVSTPDARRLAFQAAGKSLDLRLTSQFIIPAAELKRSIASAADKVQAAAATWSTQAPGPPTESSRRQPFFGTKRMESLLVDADFAGAVVYLSGKRVSETSNTTLASKVAELRKEENMDSSHTQMLVVIQSYEHQD